MSRCSVLLAVVALLGMSTNTIAQPLGMFRWQLQPFCNVLTLAVTQNGGIYTLDGVDDQCGATRRASVVGAASLNADGSVEIGFATVLAPSGVPVHIDARIDVASLGGPWHDSAGNSGTFVLTPGQGIGGAPRPVATNGLPPSSVTATQVAPGAIGAGQADLPQLQARVTGACPAGQYMQVLNANGTVVCEGATASNSYFKRTKFEFVSVPPVGQTPAQLTSMTFTAPVSGTAALRGRGYCNMGVIVGSNNQINIAAGTSAASAFASGAVSGWGIVNLPPGSVSGLYQYGWTSESRLVNIVAGSVYTVGLFGRHEAGNTNNTDCSGSFTIQIFTGTLP